MLFALVNSCVCVLRALNQDPACTVLLAGVANKFFFSRTLKTLGGSRKQFNSFIWPIYLFVFLLDRGMGSPYIWPIYLNELL